MEFEFIRVLLNSLFLVSVQISELDRKGLWFQLIIHLINKLNYQKITHDASSSVSSLALNSDTSLWSI
jgi:hypothetical protein